MGRSMYSFLAIIKPSLAKQNLNYKLCYTPNKSLLCHWSGFHANTFVNQCQGQSLKEELHHKGLVNIPWLSFDSEVRHTLIYVSFYGSSTGLQRHLNKSIVCSWKSKISLLYGDL